jgi:flavodoxin
MKTLIVYYSRTGTTKKVAETLKDMLKANSEEITETVDRSGFLGYMRAGRDAMKRKLTVLKDMKYDPVGYDMVIIGTPVWGFNVCPAIRTYLTQHKLNLKKVAFFATMGGSGGKKTLDEMELIAGKAPVATLELKERDVKNNKITPKLKKFTDDIKKSD